MFNLKRENFPNPREFNDYLERVETFVTNLAHGIDVDNTENEILRFKSENADLLERNKKKVGLLWSNIEGNEPNEFS